MPANSYTLKELQRLVKGALDERFPLPMWVEAEVSELKVNYSGHCYLVLVEKDPESALPTAQASGVIWRSQYTRISTRFEAETGQRLAAGIRLLAKVMVNYHELYGFSLQITDIDSSYTLGDIERQRRQTIERLQKEGVWDMNRMQTLPPLVQRIAIVSSAQAAGYRDFCKELAQSPFRFQNELFDAVVQGASAEDSVVAALNAVADRMEAFDAVVIIRGGGSRNDLACFDTYRLCAHIAQFPLPVLTGIGHDQDTSVADMVAHTPLKTPTAVAGWLVDRMAQEYSRLEEAGIRLSDRTKALLHAEEVRLVEFSARLKEQSLRFVNHHRVTSERQSALLQQLVSNNLVRRKMHLENRAERLPQMVREGLRRRALMLAACEEAVTGRSPERVLKLGFAVVRHGGKACTSRSAIRSGDRLEIDLSDGRLTATAD